MTQRYAPVPYLAMAVAGHQGRLAVLDLYVRAHTAQWFPFRATERELAEQWGVDRRTVAGILSALEVAGLLTVQRADQWSGTLITVADPTAPEAGSSVVGSTAPDDSASDSPSAASRVPASAPETGGGTAPTRAGEDSRASRTEPKEPNRTEKKKDMGAKLPEGPDEVACWDQYRRSWAGREPTSEERKGIRRALRKHLLPAEVVCRYIEWLARSMDPKPVYLREGGYARSDTPWSEKHFESYIELMWNPPGKERGGTYHRPDGDDLPLPPPADGDGDLPF